MSISRQILWISLLFGLLASVIAAQEKQQIGLSLISLKTEAEAVDILSRIVRGEAFEDLAKKYSIDSSAKNGGYIGTFALADLRPEFKAEVSGLRAGQVGT